MFSILSHESMCLPLWYHRNVNYSSSVRLTSPGSAFPNVVKDCISLQNLPVQTHFLFSLIYSATVYDSPHQKSLYAQKELVGQDLDLTGHHSRVLLSGSPYSELCLDSHENPCHLWNSSQYPSQADPPVSSFAKTQGNKWDEKRKTPQPLLCGWVGPAT